jgi:hypothetical protein
MTTPTSTAASRPQPVDREVLAVVTALAPILNDPRLDAHLRLDRREFDWRGALDEGTWSSGEYELIRWAGALWSGNSTGVDLSYIAGNFGGPFLDAVLGSLAAYRGQDLPAYGSDGLRR